MADSSRPVPPLVPLLLALLGAGFQVFVLWGTEWPLGVPGEWEWPRLQHVGTAWLTVIPVLIGGGFLLAYVAWVGRIIDSVSRSLRAALLIGLAMLGSGWLLLVTGSIPGVEGLGRAPFVLYYTRSSGYFFQAKYQVDDLREFWRNYEQQIGDSDLPENHLHLGTHPPGLTTANVLLLRLCRWSPRLTSIIRATEPAAVRDSFAAILLNERHSGREVSAADDAVLWLATLIVTGCAAAACIPLYLLLRRGHEPSGACWTCALWLLVPALSVFLPKSDVLFPLLTLLLQWSWLEALDHRSFWRGAVTGGLACLALLLSLAFLPVLLALALQGLLLPEKGSRWSVAGIWHAVRSRAAAFLGALLLMVLVWGVCLWQAEMNLLSLWVQNVKNHAAFYAHYDRSYWQWLWMNPLELGFALGWPLSLLAIGGLVGSRWRPNRDSLPRLIAVCVWGLLWLSGKNMGEAARLWIFLMPIAVWLAADLVAPLSSSERRRPMWLMALFVLQMIACVATVWRVDGFHFAEFLTQITQP